MLLILFLSKIRPAPTLVICLVFISIKRNRNDKEEHRKINEDIPIEVELDKEDCVFKMI